MAAPEQFENRHSGEGLDEAAAAFFKQSQEKRGIAPEPPADSEPDEEEGEEQAPDLEEQDRAEHGLEEEEAPPGSEPGMVRLPDGTEVPYHELQRGFMREADYTKKTQELAAQRSTLESTAKANQAAFEQRMAQVNGLAEQLQFEIAQHAPSAVELQRLRVEDPAEYSARMMEIQRKQNLFAQVQHAQMQMQSEARARLVAEEQARIPQEIEALRTAVPAFKKDFATEYEQLGRYALAPDGGNLRPEEWERLIDHRHVILVWKAREYDKATRKTQPQIHEKLAERPRSVRPGASAAAGDTRNRELKAAMDHMAKNPDSHQAVADVFAARERVKRARVSGRRGPT